MHETNRRPGQMSEPPCVSGRVLGTPSVGRPKAGLKTHPQCSREGGFTPALLEWGMRNAECGMSCPDHFIFFWDNGTWDKTGTDGTNGTIFQIWWDSGTSGVKYIEHNNKVSHFRDQWDKNGKSYAFRRDSPRSVYNSRRHGSAGFTPKGVTLTFFPGTLGHGTKSGPVGTRSPR
jgi:hypothetical protein